MGLGNLNPGVLASVTCAVPGLAVLVVPLHDVLMARGLVVCFVSLLHSQRMNSRLIFRHERYVDTCMTVTCTCRADACTHAGKKLN